MNLEKIKSDKKLLLIIAVIAAAVIALAIGLAAVSYTHLSRAMKRLKFQIMNLPSRESHIRSERSNISEKIILMTRSSLSAVLIRFSR